MMSFVKGYKISGSLYTVKATSPILCRTPRYSGNYWLKIASMIPCLFFPLFFYLLISGGISWKVTKKLVREKGVSVLLMPSRNYEEALACIIHRQLNRGFSLVREKEEKKFFRRFHEYLDTGELKIFSMAEPENIAKKIVSELSKTGFYKGDEAEAFF